MDISSNCSGCGLCKNICKKEAIDFTEDKLGFKYPVINEKKCIKCQICAQRCPQNHPLELVASLKACIAVSKNKYNLLNSSSGGAFFEIANSFFENNNGYLCTAAYNNDFSLMHYVIEKNQYDLKFRKSKYIQSDCSNCYKKIAELLKIKEKVVFIGTPCQCAGIKKYFADDENLLIVDLLCTGVGSPAIFQEHIKFLEEKRGKKIVDYSMRNKVLKNKNMVSSMEYSIIYEDGTCEKNEKYLNMFRTIYGRRLYFRESCYNCNYKCGQRIGDITIGDWWGKHDGIDTSLGANSIIFNTDKGKRNIDLLVDKINLVYIDSNEIFCQQGYLNYQNKSDVYCVQENISLRRSLLNGAKLTKKENVKRIVKRIVPQGLIDYLKRKYK